MTQTEVEKIYGTRDEGQTYCLAPEIKDELVVNLAILVRHLLVLCAGDFVADYILPKIPFAERLLDTLPDWGGSQ